MANPIPVLLKPRHRSVGKVLLAGRVRVPIPREIIPIAAVLGNSAHLSVQIGLLLAFTLGFGNGINWHWI
jgi:hypothetical protein